MAYSTVYHKEGLHNYFIPCHGKYSGSDMAQKAQTTVERNWQESQRTMRRLGCTDRWEGSVKY